MAERLSNDQIYQKILDANSNVQRYLDLAPSFKPTPSKQPSTNEASKRPILPAQLFRPRPMP